jgi:hypothetical protein
MISCETGAEGAARSRDRVDCSADIESDIAKEAASRRPLSRTWSGGPWKKDTRGNLEGSWVGKHGQSLRRLR